MEKAKIQAAITAIGRKAAALVKDIQNVSIEIVVHAVKHGDVTLADQLLAVVTKGVRRQSLASWFEVNGPFILVDGKFTLAKDKVKAMRATPDADLRAKLAEVRWEEAKPEPKLVSVYDASAELDKFFKRIDKIVKEGKMQVKNLEMIRTLEQKAAELRAVEVLKSIRAADTDEVLRVYGDMLHVPHAARPASPEQLHMLVDHHAK